VKAFGTPGMLDSISDRVGRDPSVSGFNVSKHEYLKARPNATFGYIATSVLVVNKNDFEEPRILLLQRASSDEDPDKWEPPGGACDDEDSTILSAAQRELWEEAGLKATKIKGLVGEPHFFPLDDGKLVCRFHFAVDILTDSYNLPNVKLNPLEHQRHLWVSASEIKAKKADKFDLEFTNDHIKNVLLLALDYNGQVGGN
jgi:8-oxo-dGTP pyrophosphatase MutT (NUDIX family)